MLTGGIIAIAVVSGVVSTVAGFFTKKALDKATKTQALVDEQQQTINRLVGGPVQNPNPKRNV